MCKNKHSGNPEVLHSCYPVDVKTLPPHVLTDIDLLFHRRANESAVEWEEWLLAEEEPLWLSERLRTTAYEEIDLDLGRLSGSTTNAAATKLQLTVDTRVPSSSSSSGSADESIADLTHQLSCHRLTNE